MSTYRVEESAIIDAPAVRVYGIFSDYHEGHPAILPSRYFTEMWVTGGGLGILSPSKSRSYYGWCN